MWLVATAANINNGIVTAHGESVSLASNENLNESNTEGGHIDISQTKTFNLKFEYFRRR